MPFRMRDQFVLISIPLLVLKNESPLSSMMSLGPLGKIPVISMKIQGTLVYTYFNSDSLVLVISSNNILVMLLVECFL